MFNRRRNGFGSDPVPDGDFNGMTGYEEKTVFPMDNSAPQAAPQAAAEQTNTAVLDDYGFAPASVTGERPMVFVSKENSGIYIYEYSDRLEYYVKLNASMFRYNVEKKR